MLFLSSERLWRVYRENSVYFESSCFCKKREGKKDRKKERKKNKNPQAVVGEENLKNSQETRSNLNSLHKLFFLSPGKQAD